jgi:site-specific DNA-methyltransferase (adenine-specific)
MVELNKIYNEDCLEGMKKIDDKSIDMILCDLPYGTTKCKWDTIIPFDKLWEQYERIIKDNGAIVLTASQPFTSALVMSNPKLFKYEWIWKKNAGSNFACLKYQPMKEHESILIFSKNKTVYNPQMQERAESGKSRVKTKINYNTNTELVEDSLHNKISSIRPQLRYPSSVQLFNRERGLHPTQKPVSLFEYLIKTYTNENDLILDNCMGSGTTAIACINNNRNFVGFELDKNYFDIANKRIEDNK